MKQLTTSGIRGLFGIAALVASAGLLPVRGYSQTNVQGQWSALQNWGVTAVHAALLPNGKVFFYPYSDDPRIWDPATNAVTAAALSGRNIFCSGQTHLADGRILVTGGHVENGWGLPNASIYNPTTNTWTALPNMNNGRWYPSQVALPNGDHLTITGSYDVNYTNNTLPQVLQMATSTWRNLTGAQLGIDLFSGMHVAPNGRVFVTIPSSTTRYLNTTGTGAWTTVGTRVGPYRGYGTSVLYDDGKVLAIGGADPPVATAEVIDLNAATPAWRFTGSMTIPRRQINGTIMADGKVLVTGGSSAAGFNEPTGAVLHAESWDPTTELWTPMASYTRYRGYHSTALLLPDGRVLSAGGDNQPNAEVFSPPYLFKGPRPSITSVPGSVTHGQGFFVSTPDAFSIAKVHLIRLGAVTHAINMDQRINRLTYFFASGGLFMTAPSNPNLCPPGYYMLFLLNGNGVPSVAKIIHVGPPIVSVPTAPSSLLATAVSTNQINLTWTSNSLNEQGFKIERQRNGPIWVEIGRVGPGVTSYSNTDLKRNTLYTYRVRAYNASGDSGYSNTASARTL